MKYPNLTAGDGEFLLNIIGGWERFQQIKAGALTLVVNGLELLQHIATTPVPAIPKFSAQETFGAEKPTVKIGYLGDNFKNHFLGKVETNISATTLSSRTLTKSSLDGPILTELGDRAQTSLVHLWHLLSQQPNGESGILLTNGDWNVFYIKDDNGTPWAVCAARCASDGDWHVGADSVDLPSGWRAGGRVFSR